MLILHGYPSNERCNGAYCWSDHYLVRAKLYFAFQKIASNKNFMEKPLAVHTSACVSMKDDYQKVLAVKFNNIESDGEVLLV